jgi:peptide/nickel transport system ATP-binding protein
MLRVEGLGIAFRQHDGRRLVPLDGVSLTVGRGQVAGLVGGSGAGKSLVAEALCGLLLRNAEVSGRLTIDGKPPGQGRSHWPRRGPLPSIRWPAWARRSRASPGWQGATCRPQHWRPTSTCRPRRWTPGRMNCRAAWPSALIATALATGAPFLIADEPTLGLDTATADRIMDLLAGHGARGIGVLIISHDLPRLVARASRVTILREGRMVETAPAATFAAGGLADAFSRDLWAAQTWGNRC